MRSISLNGSWQFRFEKGKLLEEADAADFKAADIMCVPGAFDMTPDYYCQRGTALYRREFTLERAVKNAFIVVDGMGLRCRFRIDGREAGFSALPWSRLEFATGPLRAGVHTITAAVDNNFDPEKMKLFLPYYDFYAFGGFWHGVSLKLQTDESELDRVLVRTLDYRTGKIELEFLFKGPAPAAFSTVIAFDRGEAESFAVSGGKLALTTPDFRLWSPENPHLHTVTAAVNGRRVTERFGIRCIEAGRKQLLLNGRAVYLKGFNRHESHLEFGAATPETMMIEDLQHLRKLHCNFVRGCHYPQSQRFLDLCDEFGMLVWEESLGWNNTAAQMSDPEYIRLQLEQTRLMVRNSFNHPSVIIFAFQNENQSQTEEGRALNDQLIRAVQAENSGRLVTFACSHALNDISNVETDLIAYNTYPYWIDHDAADDRIYEKIAADRDKILAYLRGRYGGDKPVIVSEMGCCGIYGQHDPAGAQWSEEFQAEYLENVIRAVFECDEICGLTLWQFADAKSYLRSGSSLRCKPMAQNLAGVFDGYRRAKLSAATVERLFGGK